MTQSLPASNNGAARYQPCVRRLPVVALPDVIASVYSQDTETNRFPLLGPMRPQLMTA